MENFKKYGIASLLYSLLFTICMYKNYEGIAFTLFCIGTAVYMYVICKNIGKSYTVYNYFLSGAIVLIGISGFLTMNEAILAFNDLALLGIIAVNIVDVITPVNDFNITENIFMLLKTFPSMMANLFVTCKDLKEFLAFRKEQKTRSKTFTYVLIGVAVSIPLLVFVIGMLSVADKVFAQIAAHTIGKIITADILGDLICIIIFLCVGFIIPYAYIFGVTTIEEKDMKKIKKNGEPIIAMVVLTAISFVYALFDSIQIAVLFMHQGTLPEGYTYAQYARNGFFELLVVAVLNIVLVVIVLELFQRHKVLVGLLEFVSACTIVMAISAVYRLLLYIDAYGLTFLRVVAMWALAIVCILLVGLMLNIMITSFDIFRYFATVIISGFIVLSLSHSEYFIAKYDLAKYSSIKEIPKEYNSSDDEQGYYDEDGEYTDIDDSEDEEDGIVDYAYIISLSADALPAMKEAGMDIKGAAKGGFYDKYDKVWLYQCEEEPTIRNFNISTYIGRKILKEYKK